MPDTVVPDEAVRAATWRLVSLIAVLCLCVGCPLLLAALTGSLSIPHNDAWAYTRIAQHYGQSGSIELVGWNCSAVLGQVVVLGPLARSILAQRVFVAALAVLGLLATYGLLEARIGRRGALLGTPLLGLTADFGLLAASYMTDIPALTATLGCLFLADRALRAGDVRYLLAALAVGTWGVTVREQAIVGPAVAVVAAVMAWRGTQRRIVLLAAGVAAGVVALFEAWRRLLPHDCGVMPIPFGARLALLVPTIGGSLFLALAVFPAVLAAARPREWSRRARRFSGATLLLSVAVVAVTHLAVVKVAGRTVPMSTVIFPGSYLSPAGAYWQVSLGSRVVLPRWWWSVLLLMACVSLSLIVGHLVHRRPRHDQLLTLPFLLVVVGTLAGMVALGQVAYMRYFLILIPITCAAVLTNSDAWPGVRRWLPWAAATVLAVTSAAVVANALAFDAARWRAATALTARGVPAQDIDAGMAWVGYHAPAPASGRFSAHADALNSLMGPFERSRECYVASASPLAGLRLDSTQQYRTYALAGASTLWIYEVSPCR